MTHHVVDVDTFPLQSRRTGIQGKPFRRLAQSMDPNRMFRVRGTLLVDPDVPVARMVHLYSERDHIEAGRVLSHPTTGAFEFLNVYGFNTYMAVATDYTGEYRAEAHDGLLPEPMA